MMDDSGFEVGDRVKKTGGDYRFDGQIVAKFRKRSGAIRFVVEDDRGLLFIFSSNNIEFDNG